MAARVVTQDAEIGEEIGDLHVPHAVIGAERMGEDDDRAVAIAFETIVETG